MLSRYLALAGCTLTLSIPAQQAHAYCRTRTTDPDLSTCPGVCAQEGLPLGWFTSVIHYSPNVRGFPGFSEAELLDTLARAIGAWTTVACDGDTVGLEVSALGSTTALESRPEGVVPEANVNVVALLSDVEWLARRYSAAAYAITGVWYNENTGEIVGADTMFNGGMGRFAICPEQGCPPESGTIDLQNVATHEFGHFLGLSHSDVPGSTMWCGASSEETEKRSLADDDLAGYCAAYSSIEAFPRDRHYQGGGACALSSHARPSRTWLSLLALLAAFALRRLRSGARNRRATLQGRST